MIVAGDHQRRYGRRHVSDPRTCDRQVWFSRILSSLVLLSIAPVGIAQKTGLLSAERCFCSHSSTQSLNDFLRNRSAYPVNSERAFRIEATVTRYNPSSKIIILQHAEFRQQIDGVVVEEEEIVRSTTVSALQAAGYSAVDVDRSSAPLSPIRTAQISRTYCKNRLALQSCRMLSSR